MHSINYITCDEKTNKALIMNDICEEAAREGDGYHGTLVWHDNTPPLNSYAEAMEFIKRHDNGWYSDHAVRFRDCSTIKSAKIDEYKKKLDELDKASRKYRNEHSVHSFTAKHIGCMNCGSKLNKEYLNGEKCPLCKTDLRSKTTMDKLRWFEQKITEYHKRLMEEQTKQGKKAKIKWLVKYEYHC